MKEEKNIKSKELSFPTSQQLENELIRTMYRHRYKKVLKSTIYTLIITAAVAVLIALLFLPVLEIYGNSMNPSFQSGDIVVSVKTRKLNRGDVFCFDYNNRLLVKRIIGLPGETIDIDDEGNVYINDKLLEEPYLSEKALGDCDIEFPYTVPEQTYFAMGDNRPLSAFGGVD